MEHNTETEQTDVRTRTATVCSAHARHRHTSTPQAAHSTDNIEATEPSAHCISHQEEAVPLVALEVGEALERLVLGLARSDKDKAAGRGVRRAAKLHLQTTKASIERAGSREGAKRDQTTAGDGQLGCDGIGGNDGKVQYLAENELGGNAALNLQS